MSSDEDSCSLKVMGCREHEETHGDDGPDRQQEKRKNTEEVHERGEGRDVL